jgi:hypothetical protein
VKNGKEMAFSESRLVGMHGTGEASQLFCIFNEVPSHVREYFFSLILNRPIARDV